MVGSVTVVRRHTVSSPAVTGDEALHKSVTMATPKMGMDAPVFAWWRKAIHARVVGFRTEMYAMRHVVTVFEVFTSVMTTIQGVVMAVVPHARLSMASLALLQVGKVMSVLRYVVTELSGLCNAMMGII